ncbi:chromo' (CHRromatin Organization MOdifier) domain protein, partial [Oesophagostomum dentatum]
EYEVEAILSHEVVDDEVVYKVSWVGYPGEITELLEEDLKNCGEMLEAYKRRMKESGRTDFTSEALSDTTSVTDKPNGKDENVQANGTQPNTPKGSPSKIQQNGAGAKASPQKETNGFANDVVVLDDDDAPLKCSSSNNNKQKKHKGEDAERESQPAKRVRKAKRREIAPDDELGYNNGCIVEEYKGFSDKYTEPVVMVSYKEPLPTGFENKQGEIVPIRVIVENDAKRLVNHLVSLLSSGRH